MANTNSKGGSSSLGKGGRSGRVRSVGAAAGIPNGAILDDTSEILANQKQRFKAWADGYRAKKLKVNSSLESWYGKMPKV